MNILQHVVFLVRKVSARLRRGGASAVRRLGVILRPLCRREQALLSEDFWRQVEDVSFDGPSLPADFRRRDIHVAND